MLPSQAPQSLSVCLDLLNETASLSETLQKILQFGIGEVGCRGAAVFIQENRPGVHLNWYTEAVPQEWLRQIRVKNGPIVQTAVAMVELDRVGSSDVSLGLVGSFPLRMNQKIFGGILWYHDSALTLPAAALQTLCSTIGWLISRSLSYFSFTDRHGTNFCDLVTATQNIFQGSEEIIQRALEGIQSLIKPDGINLFLYYPQRNHLIEKTRFDPITGNLEQHLTYLKTSLFERAILSREVQIISDLSTCEVFNPEMDGGEDLVAVAAICVPMVVDNQIVGAIELLFTHPPTISYYYQKMLEALVATLGFSIVNMRHIQQLRVANADVEANRWEIIRSRNILRALFDSLPTSIYIIDQTYMIVAINYTRAKRIADEPTQIVGKVCFEALYGRNEVCAGCIINQTLFTGNSTTRVSRIWIDDQPIEWEINTFAVLNDNNQPGQAIVIEQDVTEKRKLEANLIQSEKLAAVGQLAAGMMHEINNPLTVIIANAQILARELANDEDKLEAVKLIELAGNRATQVVQNLLGFSRKEKYDFKSVNINDTIRDAMVLLQHKLLSQSVELQLDLNTDLPPMMASRDHLEGVWVNLVMNALDAMKGQVNEKLTIASRSVNNEFRISVTDNGHGIPAERISHIFEPFFTTKSLNQGTGLGLSICHQIVKNHGGYISVDSQVGIGTKFTVVLPFYSH